jgi:hypothetical protein
MADPTGINKVGDVADVGSDPANTRGDPDTMATMRHRMQMGMAALSDSREDELDDLRFMAGSPDNQWQWPADVLATRGAVQGQTINARPCLTINKLPQHVRQVTNEQRQNRPAGKVIPSMTMLTLKWQRSLTALCGTLNICPTLTWLTTQPATTK